MSVREQELEADLQDAQMEAARLGALLDFLARAVAEEHPDAQGAARALLGQEPLVDEEIVPEKAIKGWWARQLAGQVLRTLKKDDGGHWNYFVLHVSCGDIKSTVTVQRVDGMTPDQQVAVLRTQLQESEAAFRRADDARDVLLQENAELRAQLERSRGAP